MGNKIGLLAKSRRWARLHREVQSLLWEGGIESGWPTPRSGVVAQACNCSTPETQTGGSGVPGQPEVRSETLFQQPFPLKNVGVCSKLQPGTA